MNRKIVHILLIFSIVATQVVIRCAHTHASCGEDGESLAHVHIGAECHGHVHSHEHGHSRDHVNNHRHVRVNAIENQSVDDNHENQNYYHHEQEYNESNFHYQYLPKLVLDVDENDIQPHDCSAIYFNEDCHTATLSQNVSVLLVVAVLNCPNFYLLPETHCTHRPITLSKAIPGQLPVFLQTSRILV